MTDFFEAAIEGRDMLHRVGPLIGRKVSTPDGVGILITVETPCSGMIFSTGGTQCRVWFGPERKFPTPAHAWYDPDQVSAVGDGGETAGG